VRGCAVADFYQFVSGIASAERLVTQLYPTIVSEFERRFGMVARKSHVEIWYNHNMSRFEVTIIIEAEGERYHIPIAEIAMNGSPRLYGVERAFNLMLPKMAPQK
jgi:hypothetical protein